MRSSEGTSFFFCVCRTKIYASLIVVYAKQAGKGVKNLGPLSQQEKTWACFFLSEENDDIQVFGKIECQYFRKSWTFGRKMREIIKKGGKVVYI